MFCQACGAGNSDDARFCNQCGARIAAPGMPGGPVPGEDTAPAGSEPASAEPPADAQAADAQGADAQDADAQGGAGQPAGEEPPAQQGAPKNVWEMEDGDGGGGAAASPPGSGASAGYGGSYAAPAGGYGAAPPAGGYGAAPQMTSGVTLHRIGVRSAKGTWIVLSVVGVLLFAGGAVGMWWLDRKGEQDEAQAKGGGAKPDDPFVIGMPTGADTPDVDFVSGKGGEGSAEGGGGGGSGSGGGSEGGSGESGGGSGSGAGGGSAGGGGGSGHAHDHGDEEEGGTTTVGFSGTSGSGGGESGGGGGGSGSGGSGGSESGSGGSGGSGSGSGGSESGSGDGSGGGGSEGGGSGEGDMGDVEAPEERDIEMEMYGNRLRFVVSRYYGARVESCFSRATRNEPGLSGTVVVGVKFGSDGSVSSTRVVRNTTGNEQLGACLSNQVKTWKLPPPPKSGAEIQLPFSR